MKSILSVFLVTLVSCTSSSKRAGLDTSTLTERQSPMPDLAEVDEYVRRLAAGARGYMTSEQRYYYDGDDYWAGAVWHRAPKSLKPHNPGPVSPNDYVFPGGKNVSFKCEGNVVPSEEIGRSIARFLGADCRSIPGVVITYTTGPDSGLRATASIKALYGKYRSVVQEARLYKDPTTEEVVTEFIP